MVKIKGWNKSGKLSWRNATDGILFLNIRKNKWVDYTDYDVVLKKQGAIYEIETEFDNNWMKYNPDFRWYPFGMSGKVGRKK